MLTWGFAGNSTCVSRVMRRSLRIFCCDTLFPKGLRPYSIWKNITPQLHTSTFDEMRGAPIPEFVSKHSGGRYLSFE